jgi:prepilin peptidase CpaA
VSTIADVAVLVACGASLAAAVTDARSATIPNRLTLPALGIGVALGALDAGVWGLGQALAGATLSFFVPYALFRGSRGTAIGGGDVKLLAALGALLGPRRGLEVELAALVLLLCFGLLWLTWRGQLCAALARAFWLSLGRLLPPRWRRDVAADSLIALRMGPAICVATWSAALISSHALELAAR